MDLDKLIQNYEDIIEISKQTTADLEKTLALLKSQKLNQEKELSSNVTESTAYEDRKKKLGSFRQSGKYYSPIYSSNYERRTKRN